MNLKEISWLALGILFLAGADWTRAQQSTDIPVNTFANSTNSQVESVLEKWRTFERQSKKMSVSLAKQLLPWMVRSSENIRLSPGCTRGMIKLVSGIKQMKLWAYRMLDSSGKIPNGLLGGTFTALGDYDLCVAINVPRYFQGQFCNIDLHFPLPERRPFMPEYLELPEFVNFTNPDTLVAEILRKANALYFMNLRTSVCIPSTCSVGDLEQIAGEIMNSLGLDLEVSIPNCVIKEEILFSNSEIAVICAIGIVVFIAVSATLYDVYLNLRYKENLQNQELNAFQRSLICFSFYTNTLRLLKRDDSPDSIKIFHGMKVVTILWVIFIHTYYYQNIPLMGNLYNIREFRQRIPFMIVANGYFSVETFFFITSVLIGYGITKLKGKSFNVFMYVFRRLWRLTPPFMFVIAGSFLIPYIGSGPLWKEIVVDGFIDKCKANWWTNLLFFNNFLKLDNMCFSWMWYIAAEMHLYILALFVIVPLNKNPRIGLVMNGVLLACGIIVTIINNVYYKLNPMGSMAFIHPEDISYFAERGYLRSYLHISTYSVGMATGYVLATRKKLRIPLVFNICGWVVSIFMALLIVYGVTEWNEGRVPGLGVSTLYACTSKLIWSFALSWVTIACMTGNGGIVTSILSWEAFVPLSRLTYMTYLIHPIVQFVVMGSARELIRAEHRTFCFLYFGYVVVAFIAAYPLSLLFEAPFMALEKVFISRRKPDQSDDVTKPSSQNGALYDLNNWSYEYSKSHKSEDNGIFTIYVKKMDPLN